MSRALARAVAVLPLVAGRQSYPNFIVPELETESTKDSLWLWTLTRLQIAFWRS